jgi:hypothetical protein
MLQAVVKMQILVIINLKMQKRLGMGGRKSY